jgi:hypothetical protein
MLQGCVTALITAGAVVVPGKPDGPAVHLRVIEQFVSMKIDELMDRSFREPPAKERTEPKSESGPVAPTAEFMPVSQQATHSRPSSLTEKFFLRSVAASIMNWYTTPRIGTQSL